MYPSGQNIGVIFSRKSAGKIVKQSIGTWYDNAAKIYDFSDGNPDQVSYIIQKFLVTAPS